MMGRSTRWRVLKEKEGRWAGFWSASNYSLGDGFVYETQHFAQQAHAIAWINRSRMGR